MARNVSRMNAGVNGPQVYDVLGDIIALVNELRTDHATMRTEVIAIGTTLASVKAIYDAHVHTADGNASRTSIPDAGTPTGSASAPSVIVDTSGSPPAALSAAAVALVE